MKFLLFCFTLAFASSTAYADIEGEYRCKNIDGLPDNVYKITNIAVSEGGPALPFLEIERNFRKDVGSPAKQSRIRGWATEIRSGDLTTLMIAALRLEFVGDSLSGCAK
jgi:hypothetical protein